MNRNNFSKVAVLTAVLIISFISLGGCTVKEQSKGVTSLNENDRAYYEPNWQSLKRYTAPEWYRDAKFGIFIHWGPYSVPAFGNEWYPRRMYTEYFTTSYGEVRDRKDPIYQYHQETYGADFGYKDFISMFKAQKWNPRKWAELFQKSGAKYVVPVATHHDGFAMYDSSYTKWNSVNMGPKRDIIGELARETRKLGMKFGVSSHYAFNWNYYTFKEGFDTVDPANSGLYGEPHEMYIPPNNKFLKKWQNRTIDIIDKYQPDLLYFDFYIQIVEFEPYLKELWAYYYNHAMDQNKGIVLNYKDMRYKPLFPEGRFIDFPVGCGVRDIEKGKMTEIQKYPWQTDTSISQKSWGYIENEEYKTPDRCIDDLIDIVSKNGCLLLNVNPKPDGTIPQPSKDVLLEIGKWLKVNGDAIYGTRCWKVYGEGPTPVYGGRMSEAKNKSFTARDIRFTTKGDTLYAICLARPEKEVKIKSLGTDSGLCSKQIKEIRMLGLNKKLEWICDKDYLTIKMPSENLSKYACAFRITF